MEGRWAIYIDVEGFSALYPEGNDAMWALNKLMLAVHRIGKLTYPKPVDRLFAHQIGDGFLIVSDFHEENLNRAASIAIVLMKFITSFGVFARASIAEGELAGISGCYPREVTDDFREGDNLVATMGSGLMTIFPVMGTALINAVGIDKRAPKGPMLTLPQGYRSRITSSILSKVVGNTGIIAIDWVHADFELITQIKSEANLEFPSPDNLEVRLANYLSKHELPSEWRDSCSSYLGVANA